MRSPQAGDHSAGRDQTARARIRDAAIRRFGVEGFDVGLRAIAQDAQVSPALVLHHFGSKEGLRQACDEYVLRVTKEHKSAAVSPSGPTALLMSWAALDELAPLVGYAIRSMQAGGEVARSFIDHFAADAEEYLASGVDAGTIRPSHDDKARARYLTVQGFGAMLLDMALNPPADPRDFEGMVRGYIHRHGLVSVELFTQGLYTDHRMLEAYLMYVTDPPSSSTAPDRPTGGNPPSVS